MNKRDFLRAAAGLVSLSAISQAGEPTPRPSVKLSDLISRCDVIGVLGHPLFSIHTITGTCRQLSSHMMIQGSNFGVFIRRIDDDEFPRSKLKGIRFAPLDESIKLPNGKFLPTNNQKRANQLFKAEITVIAYETVEIRGVPQAAAQHTTLIDSQAPEFESSLVVLKVIDWKLPDRDLIFRK